MVMYEKPVTKYEHREKIIVDKEDAKKLYGILHRMFNRTDGNTYVDLEFKDMVVSGENKRVLVLEYYPEKLRKKLFE